MARDLIPDRIEQWGAQHPGRAAIWDRVGESWRALTWGDYVAQARAFAGALLAEGYEPGWGVAILSNNRPEWFVADVGSMWARAVPAGVYQTLTAEQVAYIGRHCAARVVVVEDRAQWAKIDAQRSELPELKRIVVLDGAAEIDDPMVIDFEAFLETGRGHSAEVDARFAELKADDLAMLIYTSGTTGHPKGVMLTHDNLAFTAQAGVEVVGSVDHEDCVVSYLPLSHIAEQMISLLIPSTAGYPIWIARRAELLKETLVAARPTLFLGVPRVWEKFKAALEVRLGEAGGAKKIIADWAMGVGRTALDEVVERGEPAGLLGLQYRLADRLFYGKLRGALGLDRLKVAFSGAAPIGKDVLTFFGSLGIVIHEVYGQSEDTGPSTFNQPVPGKRRLGTVGLPFPGVEIKIADDGEILVRGRNVFRGYLGNPEATAEALVDGWLHSGDIGAFDADGFLRITDRKKDLIITAGGKNVAPQHLEKLLKAIPGVGNAVVIGDRRKYLSALLTLDPEGAPALAKANGWPTEVAALADHPGLLAHLDACVQAANASLARYETLKRWAVIAEDFTVEGGELTPTQKVKRRVVNEKYAAQIEGLYD